MHKDKLQIHDKMPPRDAQDKVYMTRCIKGSENWIRGEVRNIKSGSKELVWSIKKSGSNFSSKFFSGRSTMPTKWWSVWNMQQKLISGKSIFIIGQKIFFLLLTKVSLPCTKLWGFAENDSLNKTGNWLICISS